jgi:YD repeat-containing protein
MRTPNPIHIGLGIKMQEERDYQDRAGFLRFERSYASGLQTHAFLGVGWRHTYQRQLVFISHSIAPTVRAYRENGRVLSFDYSSNGITSDPDISDRVFELKDASNNRIGWQYLVAATEDTETYDSEGTLRSIATRTGLTTTLHYDNQGRLETVTDPFGRTLTFTYDGLDRLATMTDPANGVYTYGYDANNNLISVTYPDATPGDTTDNPTRIYHYEDTRFLNNLTGITDENGDRFATYTYDDLGLAMSSEHAGGAEKTTVTYDLVNLTSTVTDALKTTRTYTFTVSHGVMKVTGITQPAQ